MEFSCRFVNPTVCFTYDFDAVSPWLWSFDLPNRQSQGVYGADIGTPRLLDLHEEHDIPSTWFIPGHTIESFPKACEQVMNHGHEIQFHGYSHAPFPSFNTKEGEEREFIQGIKAIEDLTGKKPTGFRSPLGGFSEFTIDLVQKYDFDWMSSGSAREFKPYYPHRDGTISRDEPYDRGTQTDMLNVPLSWQRDDWELTGYIRSSPQSGERVTAGSMMAPSDYFDRMHREFEWMAENVEHGVYVLLFHPQISGRANMIQHIEEFIELMRSYDAEFKDLSTYVEDYRAAQEP